MVYVLSPDSITMLERVVKIEKPVEFKGKKIIPIIFLARINERGVTLDIIYVLNMI